MPSLLEVLEADLVADPDDLATHMAYADYLQEQGDPRGEFIHVQLTLEQPKLKAGQRPVLKKRAASLLNENVRAWLGDLAPYLLEQQHSYATPYKVQRGWLDTLFIEDLSTDLARTIAHAP